ncbi:MAG: UDP-N-acetylglucosamine 1-carboxyvinyltransferase, partial [Bacillota bacterium]
SGRIAVIRGVKRLTGAQVDAWDLRGGAALILAGLRAEGETVVHGAAHIDRGYEAIERDLAALGAQIRRDI